MPIQKTKIVIYTAMHDRHIISRLWCIGITRFIKAAPLNYEIKIFAVISSNESAKLCDEFGIHYIITENKPLGRKFNNGLDAINNHSKLKDYDYLILFGDDDLISDQAWFYYREAIQNKEHFVGFGSIYFYDPNKDITLLFDYKTRRGNNKSIGAGRLISREAIHKTGYLEFVTIKKQITLNNLRLDAGQKIYLREEIANYLSEINFCKKTGNKVFSLWRAMINTGLDHSSEMNLLFAGFKPTCFDCNEPLIVDIKSDINIWKINHYQQMCKSAKKEDVHVLISGEEVNYIENNLIK